MSSPEQNATRFAVTAHSFILGLKSDIVIRLLDEGETTYVDVRSLSRYGKRDMGQNAGFITDFLGRWKARSTRLQPTWNNQPGR